MKTLLLLFLFLPVSVFAQRAVVIDSLENELSIQKRDTARVNTLNDLAWELKKLDSTKALKYAAEAKKLSISLGFKAGELKSEARRGNIYLSAKNYDKAETILLDLLKEQAKWSTTYEVSNTHNQLGSIYRKKDKHRKSSYHYHSALRGFVELKNYEKQALVLNNLSRLERSLSNFEEALKYLHESIEIREEIGEPEPLAKSYANMGSYYFKVEDYSQALNYYSKAREIYEKSDNKLELSKVLNGIGASYSVNYQLDKAITYYSKSLELKRELGIEEKDAEIYVNLGSLHFRKHDFDKAYDNYLKAMEIQKKSPSGEISAVTYYNFGNIFFERKNYQKAIKYYQLGLKEAIESEEKMVQIDLYKNLSQCFAGTRDYEKAYEFSEKSNGLSKEISDKYKKAVSIDQRYQTEKAEKESLLKDKEIHEANAELQRILLFSVGVAILLLLFAFLAFYRSRKHRLQAEINEKNIRIEQQKIQELMSEMEIKSMNSMLEGQEEERQRIAADLHDRLGSMLSMVKLHFESMDRNINSLKEKNKKQYEMATQLLDNACSEVRKIAHNMISGVLDKFGLVSALEDFAISLNNSGKISVEFISFGMKERLNRKMEVTIYRIVQELVTNTLKHAQANEITIQLLQSKGNLNLIVEDDGMGFDVNNKSNSGIGLKNLSSRVQLIDGKMTVDSSEKTGTTITIDIPNSQNETK